MRKISFVKIVLVIVIGILLKVYVYIQIQVTSRKCNKMLMVCFAR